MTSFERCKKRFRGVSDIIEHIIAISTEGLSIVAPIDSLRKPAVFVIM